MEFIKDPDQRAQEALQAVEDALLVVGEISKQDPRADEAVGLLMRASGLLRGGQ